MSAVTLAAGVAVAAQGRPHPPTGGPAVDGVPAVTRTTTLPRSGCGRCGDPTTGVPVAVATTTSTASPPADASQPPGSAPAPPSGPVLTCPSDADGCIQVDAEQLAAPLTHVGTGFLHDTAVGQPSVAARLGPTSWRVAILPKSDGRLDMSAFDAAKRYAPAAVTVVVSDAWYWASNNGCGVPSATCGARPPWRDYAAYSNWLQGYVHQIEASGRHPDYWEVQNEPDNATVPGNYYDVADAQTATVPDELEQFEIAYHAVKSADPRGKVMGPSLGMFRASPTGRSLDMSTFLSYSDGHALRWDALSWHEITPGARGPQPDATITADVATTRALLEDHPGLGSPAIAVTEYGDPSNRLLPGWIVGDVAAFEGSGVTWADRTCAVTLTDPAAGNECTRSPSTLDGLLLGDGLPTAAYWTYRAYSTLAGRRVAVFSSSPTLSVIGTRDPAGAVRVLIGRHETCTHAVNPDCDDDAPLPNTLSLPMVVAVPWNGPAAVTVDRIANVRGAVSGPVRVVTVTVDAPDRVLRLTIPGIGDGDAFVVTARPAGA